MKDTELVAFCEALRNGLLGGRPSNRCCFMVCSPLVTLLNRDGVACKMTNANHGIIDHYWLTLPDGRVLDPTADQFRRNGQKLPPVYLGPPIAKIHKPVERTTDRSLKLELPASVAVPSNFKMLNVSDRFMSDFVRAFDDVGRAKKRHDELGLTGMSLHGDGRRQ